MPTNLSSDQKRAALAAALDWVGAYEGHGATIEQGARDVPQDLLDAFILLQDLVDQADRAEYKAEFIGQARVKYAGNPNVPDWAITQAAKEAAAKAYPSVTRKRLISVDE